MSLILAFFMMSFMASAQNVIHYQDFQYYTNSGFTSFATSNPDGETITASSGSALISRKTGANDVATESTLGYTRPLTTIPDGATRKITSVKMSGNYGSNNLNATTWVVTDAIDISNQTNMIVSFATKNAFKEESPEAPSSNSFKVMIAKNYTDGTSPDDGSVTWVDVTADIIDSNNDGKVFGNDGAFAYTTIDLTSYISDSGSDKFALAFKYEFTDAGDYDSAEESTQPIRNGAWWISDVRYYIAPADVADGAFSALNTSFSGQTNIFNTPSASISDDNFSNTGKWGNIFIDDTSAPRLADGKLVPVNEGYLFEVSGAYNAIVVTEVRHKLANSTETKGATGDSQWVVQASNDATTWETVSEIITVASNSSTEIATALSPTQAYRYYRFVLSNEWTPSQLYTALQQLDFTTDTTALSIDDTILESSITVYPNPTNSIINIQNNGDLSIASASLVDLTGKTIAQSNGSSIDVSTLAKGMYVLKITATKGAVTSKKIIVN